MRIFFPLLLSLHLLRTTGATASAETPADTARYIVMAGQSQQRAVIFDIVTSQTVWEWKPPAATLTRPGDSLKPGCP